MLIFHTFLSPFYNYLAFPKLAMILVKKFTDTVYDIFRTLLRIAKSQPKKKVFSI